MHPASSRSTSPCATAALPAGEPALPAAGTGYRLRAGAPLALAAVLGGCQVPAATQALIDEYNATIPVCEGAADCEAKWQAAYSWVLDTATYTIRVASPDRIETYNADNTRAGTAVQVTREALGGDRYRFLVNVDCFAIYGCPPIWETRIDFNRIVGRATP